MFQKIFKIFIATFLKGILVLSPFIITFYILFWFFTTVDTLIFKDLYPGLGILFILLLITFVGYLSSRFIIGRWITQSVDQVLSKMPGVKILYIAVKDILNSFVGDDKKFEHAVWVKVDQVNDIWRIGFITQSNIEELGGKVAVYLPHSYAISGWVILVDKSSTKKIEGMSAAEAMKFSVSGGVTGSLTKPPLEQ